MTIYPRHLVLLVVDAAGARITGKTYLQKTCFFVGTLLGETKGYRDFYWGPYSDDVSAEITTLTAVGYLRQQRRRGERQTMARGWEEPCDYSVTDEGRLAVAYVRSAFAEEWESVNDAVRRILDAGMIDYVGLSLAAQTCWLEQKHMPRPLEHVVEQVQEFWPLEPRQIDDARRFLQNLQLAPHQFA